MDDGFLAPVTPHRGRFSVSGPPDSRPITFGTRKTSGGQLTQQLLLQSQAARLEQLEEELRVYKGIKRDMEQTYRDQLDAVTADRDALRLRLDQVNSEIESIQQRATRKSFDVATRGMTPSASTVAVIRPHRPRVPTPTPPPADVPTLLQRISELEAALADTGIRSPVPAHARTASTTVMSTPERTSRASDAAYLSRDLERRLAEAEARAEGARVRSEVACANATKLAGSLEAELALLRAETTTLRRQNAELSRGTPPAGTIDGKEACESADTMPTERLRVEVRRLVFSIKEHERAEAALLRQLEEALAAAGRMVDKEYVRNSLLKFFESDDSQRRMILPALLEILGFSAEEKQKVLAALNKKAWKL